jgi:hypothetical protein
MMERKWLAREPGKTMSYPTLLALPKKSCPPVEGRLERRSTVLAR